MFTFLMLFKIEQYLAVSLSNITNRVLIPATGVAGVVAPTDTDPGTSRPHVLSGKRQMVKWDSEPAHSLAEVPYGNTQSPGRRG